MKSMILRRTHIRTARGLLAETDDPVRTRRELAVAFAKLGVLRERTLEYLRDMERGADPGRISPCPPGLTSQIRRRWRAATSG